MDAPFRYSPPKYTITFITTGGAFRERLRILQDHSFGMTHSLMLLLFCIVLCLEEEKQQQQQQQSKPLRNLIICLSYRLVFNNKKKLTKKGAH